VMASERKPEGPNYRIMRKIALTSD